jgi:hypothetical protein
VLLLLLSSCHSCCYRRHSHRNCCPLSCCLPPLCLCHPSSLQLLLSTPASCCIVNPSIFNRILLSHHRQSSHRLHQWNDFCCAHPPSIISHSPCLPCSPSISYHILLSEHYQLIVIFKGRRSRLHCQVAPPSSSLGWPPLRTPPHSGICHLAPLPSPLARPSIARRASTVCQNCWLIVIFIHLPPADHHLLCWVDTLVYPVFAPPHHLGL